MNEKQKQSSCGIVSVDGALLGDWWELQGNN